MDVQNLLIGSYMLPSIDSQVTEVLEIYIYGTQGIMESAYDFHLCI